MKDKITLIFIVIFVSAFLAFYLSLLIIYGNKPVGEIPTWVAWFLFKD